MLTTAEGTTLGSKTAMEPTDKENGFDPFLYRPEMPYSAMFFPLGFPLRLTTNSQEVMEAMQESWGMFQQRFDVPPIRMQIGVLATEATECPPVTVPRAHGSLITYVADAGNFCVVDVVRDFSFAWVTTAAVSHRRYLRYYFLETAALSHLSNRQAAPVHAACVALNGRGVLLCGESGAGKSSLAFACARAGWTYISDDASYLVHGREDRQVVGNCHTVRLRPASATFFEEVRGRPLTPRMWGKPSVELMTAELPHIVTAGEAQAEYMVFLKRNSDGVQEMRPCSREVARRYVHRRVNIVEEFSEVQTASVDRLLSAQVYELHYYDLDWAVAALERLVREGS